MNIIEKEIKLDQQTLKTIQADLKLLKEEFNNCKAFFESEKSQGGSTLTKEEEEQLDWLAKKIVKAEERAFDKEQEILEGQKLLTDSRNLIEESKLLFNRLENAFAKGNLASNSYNDWAEYLKACEQQKDNFTAGREILEEEYPILQQLNSWAKRIQKQMDLIIEQEAKKQEEVSLSDEKEFISSLNQVFVKGNLESTSYQDLVDLNNTCIKYIQELSAKGVLTPKQNQVLIELEEWHPKLRDKLLQRKHDVDTFKENVISLVELIKIEKKLFSLQSKIEAIPEDGDGKSIEELEQGLKNCNHGLNELIAPYQKAKMPERAREKTEAIEKLIENLTQKIKVRKHNINQEYKGKDGSDLSRVDQGFTKILVSANTAASQYNSFLQEWYNAVDNLTLEYSNASLKIDSFKEAQQVLDSNIKLVTDIAVSVTVTALAAPLGTLAATSIGNYAKDHIKEIIKKGTDIWKDLGKDITKQFVKSGVKTIVNYQAGKGKIANQNYKTPSFDPTNPNSGFRLATALKAACFEKFNQVTQDIDNFRQQIKDMQIALPDKELLSILPKEDYQKVIKVILDSQQRIAAKWDAFNDQLSVLLSKRPNPITKAKAFNEFYHFCWCAWISTFRTEGLLSPDHKIVLESNVIDEMDRLGFFKSAGADRRLFDSNIYQAFDGTLEYVMPTLTGQHVSKLVNFANIKLKEYTSANYWKSLLGI